KPGRAHEGSSSQESLSRRSAELLRHVPQAQPRLLALLARRLARQRELRVRRLVALPPELHFAASALLPRQLLPLSLPHGLLHQLAPLALPTPAAVVSVPALRRPLAGDQVCMLAGADQSRAETLLIPQTCDTGRYGSPQARPGT